MTEFGQRALALNQEIKQLNFVVDGTLQPTAFSADGGGDLIEAPTITRARPNLPQIGCNGASKLQEPAVVRLTGHIDAWLREQLIKVKEGQRAPGIRPDRASDVIGWGAVAFTKDLRNPAIYQISGRHR